MSVRPQTADRRPPRSESLGASRALLAVVLVYLGLMLVLPLATIFLQAFGKGLGPVWRAITDPDAIAALRLTAVAASCAVAINTVFGLAVAWLVTRFDFPGRRLIVTVLDVPLMISPVIAGMLFVLLFGSRGIFAPLLARLGLQVLFATPGIILVTVFVTLPYVARELIAFMQTEGSESEQAAVSLGARGWMTFRRITLPSIRWSLLYGIVLCAARAVGEFGAVSVVSGHIRGLTNTATLHIEVLYDEYQTQEAFAVAALLTVIALFAVIAKRLLASHDFERAVSGPQTADRRPLKRFSIGGRRSANGGPEASR
jgi:sulfate/thiosulfate transport system permease protein